MKFDAVVVGAGIMGLALAESLQRRGKQVLVIERDEFAVGATVRNFGMIWPVGQPVGFLRDLALKSRDRWLNLLESGQIWHRACGSLQLAYAEDEAQVIQEFLAQVGPEGGRWLSAEEASKAQPGIQSKGLMGAMLSSSELCVDPRRVAADLARLLAERGVEFRWKTAVIRVSEGIVETDLGTFESPLILLATGPAANGLRGSQLQDAGLQQVRLQMLRVEAPGIRLNHHLSSSLTLLHYGNYAACPSLPQMRARLEATYPEEIRRGIHILASQHGDGLLTIGDSHDYGTTFRPYGQESTDNMILARLNDFLPMQVVHVRERWQGTYIKHSHRAWVHREVEPGVHLVNGVGGAGMTMSFGVAEYVVADVMGERSTPQLVVFDMAGTTIHDPDYVNLALQEALSAAGIERTREQVNRYMGIAKPVAIKAIAGDIDDDQVVRIHSDFVERMLSRYRESTEIRPIVGIEQLLAQLRNRGIKIALDTGFSTDIAQTILERVGWRIGCEIDALICADQVPTGRPAPDMIFEAMRRTGVQSVDRVAKVGDTPSDLGEGTAARCARTIGVTYGTHKRDEFPSIQGVRLVDSVFELESALLDC